MIQLMRLGMFPIKRKKLKSKHENISGIVAAVCPMTLVTQQWFISVRVFFLGAFNARVGGKSVMYGVKLGKVLGK